MVANIKSSRGRPRAFDTEAALDVGQKMFHSRGYEAVGLAALTDALGIKPPSFYAAFDSKSAYFGRILERYAASQLVLDDILTPGRAPVAALQDLLQRAATLYAKDPDCLGCLVLEAARGHIDTESALLARRVLAERRAKIHAYVEATRPDLAQAATDCVSSTMSGLSASAREGIDEARLLRMAAIASLGLQALFKQ